MDICCLDISFHRDDLKAQANKILALKEGNATNALKSLKSMDGKALVDILRADGHQTAADFIGAFMIS